LVQPFFGWLGEGSIFQDFSLTCVSSSQQFGTVKGRPLLAEKLADFASVKFGKAIMRKLVIIWSEYALTVNLFED